MKKLVALGAACVFAAMGFVGCKSTPIGLADYSPVVIVSVSGNQSLPWKEDSNPNADDTDKDADGDGVLSNLVNKLLNGDDVELTSGRDRLDYAADSMRQLLIENAGVEVVDPDVVLNSESYLNARESVFSILDAKISATNYKDLMKIGAKTSRLIMEDNGAKSLILVDFTFQKTNISGNKWNGKVAASVTMKIRYLNERGKELVNREYVATSLESLRVQSRKYDKNALVDLFPDTIDAVINQFIVENL